MANSIYKNRILSHNTDLNQIIQTIGNLPPAGTEDITAELDALSAAVDSHVSMIGRKVAENNGAGEYVWKKHLKINVTQTGLTSSPTFLISSDDIDVTTLTAEDFVGFVMGNEMGATITFLSATASVYAYDGTVANESTWSYDPATATMRVNGTGNFTVLRTWEFTETLKFDYVVSDDENAYPNDAIHTDGHYYEKGESGQYVWKKYKVVPKQSVTFRFVQENHTARPIYLQVQCDVDVFSEVDADTFVGYSGKVSGGTAYSFSFESGGVFTFNETPSTYTYDKENHKLEVVFGSIQQIYNWPEYTVELSEYLSFLDYVVADDETAYPNGVEQDGYYYERVKGTKYGILFNNVDSNGYPTDLVYNVPCVTSFGNTKTFLDSITKNALTVELDCQNTAIAQNGLENAFTDFGGKLKLKNVPSIGNSGLKGFQMDATSGKRAVYIPVSCTTVGGANSTSGCFYAANASTKIYCGASSRPSGFGTYWNYYTTNGQLSVTWSVTEEQFDAL